MEFSAASLSLTGKTVLNKFKKPASVEPAFLLAFLPHRIALSGTIAGLWVTLSPQISLYTAGHPDL
jgi:hypothetical protein